jgi:hypothetical protein
VRNEEMLQSVREEKNILHAIKRMKANCSGHILRRNCLLQQIVEGKREGGIQVTGMQGRRRKQLLFDF